MYRRASVLLVAVLAFALSGCGGVTDSATPVQANPGNPGTSVFDSIDAETAKLVTTDAHWHAPASLDVDKTERVALSVGDGKDFANKINQLIPKPVTTDAGPVQVGPSVSVSLHADAGDAEITPSEAVNASTGSNVQMLWTWLVHPLRPTKRLLLTAYLDVPLSDGKVIHNELPLTLEVDRTFAYTAAQVFTHWATWSAIGGTLVTVAAWLWRRRRRIAAAVLHEESPAAA